MTGSANGSGAGTLASPAARRRTYGPALLLGLGGGALVAVGSARRWGTATTHEPGLPAVPVSVTGADAVPVVAALGLVILAAVVVVVATANVGRRLAGAAIVVSGACAGWLTAAAGSHIHAALRDKTLGAGAGSVDWTGSGWRWAVLAGAVAAVASGVLTVAKGPSWPKMGSRYAAPNVRRPEVEPEQDLWKSLDAGEDPTT